MRVVEETGTAKVAISLPVVVDFQGSLSRGVTFDLSADSLSIVTDLAPGKDSSISIQFSFAKDFAYMRLAGQVTSTIEEKGYPSTHYRIVIQLVELGDPERSILESSIQELRSYLKQLELNPLSDSTASHGSTLERVSNPRAILSLFITDNPYPLEYSLSIGNKLEDQSSPDINAPSKSGLRSGDGPERFQKVESGFFSWLNAIAAVRLVLPVGRDLLIRILPRRVSRFLSPAITFAFIAHPRDLSDIPRKFPFARFLSSHLVELWFRYQWPFVASYITGLRTRDGKETTGAMLISPLTTEQMIRNPRVARNRVYRTVQLAERMGAKIVGLGAFASIVTRDGQDLSDKVRVGLTTGNPYSAAIAVQNILEAAALTNLSLPHATVAIVGAAGSVGSACARLLASLVAKLILIDVRKEELKNVLELLENQAVQLEATSLIETIKEADAIIAATSSPYTLICTDHLKPGAIVIDAAQPKNVSEQIPHRRRDVLVIESAIVQTPGIECNFDLGLSDGEALGCLSETMVLTATGWEGHYSVGKADPQLAADMIVKGRQLGFRLAKFRNSDGYVTEADLIRVAKARLAKPACA